MLIVEDNELVTGALRILFEETGRRVTVAHSVAEAVEKGRKDPPDLLLLDLTLPDGDGLDVARSLAQAGIRTRATVAITGRDDLQSRERCARAGCTEMMVKPVASRELLSKTDTWLADYTDGMADDQADGAAADVATAKPATGPGTRRR